MYKTRKFYTTSFSCDSNVVKFSNDDSIEKRINIHFGDCVYFTNCVRKTLAKFTIQ